MNRGLPPLSLRPRPAHLFVFVDLAVIALIFFFAGRVYTGTKGEEVLRLGENQREEAQQRGARSLAEADSVVTVARAALATAQAESLRFVDDLAQRLAALDAAVLQQQRLAETFNAMRDSILHQRAATDKAKRLLKTNQNDVRLRRTKIAVLTDNLATSERARDQARWIADSTSLALDGARRTRAHEPVGLFPARSGLLLAREVGGEEDRSLVELQQNVTRVGDFDLGLSLAAGFATGGSSVKHAGLLVSRNLVHRRVSLDAAAGYLVLTDSGGETASGTFGSLGLRFSPIYSEHLHFGIGARATEDEVMPYIGIGVGRR
jgi:hypothetical protein